MLLKWGNYTPPDHLVWSDLATGWGGISTTYLTQFGCCIALAFFVMRYYADVDVHVSAKCLFFGVQLCSYMMVCLVPIDINETHHLRCLQDGGDKGNLCVQQVHHSAEFGSSINPRLIYALWSTCYWTLYCFTWVLIPGVVKFNYSGHFSTEARIKFSFRENVVNVGLLFCAGMSMLLYLHLHEVPDSNLLPMAAAINNAVGLFLGIFLLGWATVEVPRRIWYSGDYVLHQRRTQFKACGTHDGMEKSKKELMKAVAAVAELEKMVGDMPERATVETDFKAEMQSYMVILNQDLAAIRWGGDADVIMKGIRKVKVKRKDLGLKKPDEELEMIHVCEMRRRLRNSAYAWRLAQQNWREVCAEAWDCEDRVANWERATANPFMGGDSRGSGSGSGSGSSGGGGGGGAGDAEAVWRSSLSPVRNPTLAVLTFYWRVYGRWLFLRGASLCCGALSVLIVSSEGSLILYENSCADVATNFMDTAASSKKGWTGTGDASATGKAGWSGGRDCPGSLKLSPFYLLTNIAGQSTSSREAICWVLVVYTAACIFYSIIEFKLAYRLYGMWNDQMCRTTPHATDSIGMCVNCLAMARVGPAVIWNIYNLMFETLKGTSRVSTQFALVMGNQSVSMFLGPHFQSYFPVAICVYAACTLFNVTSKLFGCFECCFSLCGARRFIAEKEYSGEHDPDTAKGAALLAAERLKAEAAIEAQGGMAALSLTASLVSKTEEVFKEFFGKGKHAWRDHGSSRKVGIGEVTPMRSPAGGASPTDGAMDLELEGGVSEEGAGGGALVSPAGKYEQRAMGLGPGQAAAASLSDGEGEEEEDDSSDDDDNPDKQQARRPQWSRRRRLSKEDAMLDHEGGKKVLSDD